MIRAKSQFLSGLTVAILVGAAGPLSGCAYTMGELAQQKNAPEAQAADASLTTVDTTASLKPAALVEEEPLPAEKVAPAGAATATAIAPGGYPNLNLVPPPEKSKLLSPEEKARVMADLEALAQKQASDLAKERATADKACDGLSAEDLRKRMLQGQC